MKLTSALASTLFLASTATLALAQTQPPPPASSEKPAEQMDAKAKCTQEAKDQQLTGDAEKQYVKECVEKAKGKGY